jgi:hypothetical protein
VKFPLPLFKGFVILHDQPGVPLRFTPGFNPDAPFGRSASWMLKVRKDASAGGAKDYSPEWRATELRASIPSPSNPCRGVTEMTSYQEWERFDYGGAFRRPLSGALSILFDKPGVPLRFTPGSTPAHPLGAGDNSPTAKAARARRVPFMAISSRTFGKAPCRSPPPRRRRPQTTGTNRGIVCID